MAGRRAPGRRAPGRHRAPGRASWRVARPDVAGPAAARRTHPFAVVGGSLLAVVLTGGLTGASAGPFAAPAGPAPALAATTPATATTERPAADPASLRAAAAAQVVANARSDARAMADAAYDAAHATTAGLAPGDPNLAALAAAVARLDRASAPAQHGPASDGRTDRQVTAELTDATAEVFAAAQQAWVTTPDAGVIDGVRWTVPESLAALEERVAAVGSMPQPILPAPTGRAARAGLAVPTPDELCPIPFAPDAVLRCDAAERLGALNEAYRAEHGTDLVVTSAFRTYAEQVAVRASRGALAATPGTSNHEVGVAVDLGGMGGLGQFDAPAYLWMKDRAADFGWYHPADLEPGGSGPEEPWHWEYGG